MKSFKLLILAALAFVCAAQVQAQSTNLVQNLSVQLLGFKQGGTSHFANIVTTNVDVVQINTRQIIQALAAASANSFSSTSKLVTVTPINGGRTSVQVRDGNKAPVDVTDFFNLETLSDSVSGSVVNTRNGHGTVVSYQIVRVALQDAWDVTLNLHFDVNGIATSNTSTPNPNSTIDANVSGSGDRNGNFLILQGSVDIFGRTLEVDFNGGVS